MDNKQNKQIVISRIFMAAGLFVLIIGLVSGIIGMNHIRRWDKVTATITKLESYYDSDDDITRHTTYVSYTYNGADYYDVRLSEYSSSMFEGKRINIIVNPDAPEKISTGLGSTIFGIMFYVGGMIFFIVGGVEYVQAKKLKKV